MAKTIVALFDQLFEARKAVEELENAGFTRDRIDLVQGDEAVRYIEQRRIGGGGPVTERKSAQREGTFSRAWHRLESLVGMGAETHDVRHYEEGIRRGGSLVVLADIDDSEVDRAVDIMERHHPVDIDKRMDEWRKAGWSEAAVAPGAVEPGVAPPVETVAAPAEPVGAAPIEPVEERQFAEKRGEPAVARESLQGERRIPIVEEELSVGKRVSSRGGVRVHTHVEEKPVSEEVRLREERVRVERRPTEQRPVGAGEEAFKEQTFEFTEEGEEAVVGKRARVVEEVVIGKEVGERVEQVRDTIRRTEVDVERTGEKFAPVQEERAKVERSAMPHLSAADSEDFHRHFESHFAGRGFRYDDFEEAYLFGQFLATDERFKHLDWNEIEPEAKRIWESEHKGQWDVYEGAIHHGWSRAPALV